MVCVRDAAFTLSLSPAGMTAFGASPSQTAITDAKVVAYRLIKHLVQVPHLLGWHTNKKSWSR